MKTVTFLAQKLGENVTTKATPVRVYNPETDAALLTKQANFCWSYDDDQQVMANLYETMEVELPDWLDPEEWLGQQVEWKYTWGFGIPKDWPEAWQRGLKRMGQNERMAAFKLLKTKTFRSTFRASLKDQLVAWLETPTAERKFGSPFSYRQWEKVIDVHICRTAEGLATSLYHDR